MGFPLAFAAARLPVPFDESRGLLATGGMLESRKAVELRRGSGGNVAAEKLGAEAAVDRGM
eukprot:180987-Amphidinium_carterae.1